ncbi:MAG: ATP-binding protein [Anaerolineae bacterium]|nr:ATP-binding protein [Anaerolineae bacterium]
MRKTLTIAARFEELAKITPVIESMITAELSQVRDQVVLAVHELCVNVVQHGYAGVEGLIALEAERQGRTLTVSITDGAPNAYSPPDEIVPPDPMMLPESGWGIYILHQVMDQVHYQRLPSGNQWILVKEIGEELNR